jgi:CubicO group peptidase (beta-lactamase class C family)
LRIWRKSRLYTLSVRKWGYNNAAFVTAGEIIPQVTDESWETFLKENILSPLGMNNTLVLSKDITSALNKSAAHTMSEGLLKAIPYPLIDNLAPAGSMSSSVSDLSKWVLALLHKGKVGNKTVLPEEAINTTWTPTSIMGNSYHPFNHSNFQLYGLGWMLQDYEGRRMVMHTGGVNGFVSSVTLVPEENLGIIILTNTDQNNFYEALKWDVIDAYLKLPFRNYNKHYLTGFQQDQSENLRVEKRMKDSVTMNLRPALSLNAYTGKYFNEVYGYLTIDKNDKELQVKFEHHPRMFARLQALGGNRFYATFSDPVFSKSVFPFHIVDGKVKSMTLKVADFIELTSYEFTKVK